MKSSIEMVRRQQVGKPGRQVETTKAYSALQFNGQDPYTIDAIESTTAVSMGLTPSGLPQTTWELPAGIYDDISLVLSYSALLTAAGTTVSWTNPVQRVEFQINSATVSNRYYQDFILAYKASDRDMRELIRSESCFVDEITLAPGATSNPFDQTIHLCGQKSYGHSEDLSSDSSIYIVQPGDTLLIKITFRNPFTTTDPLFMPIINLGRIKAFKRMYDNPAIANAIYTAARNGMITYDSVESNKVFFTSDGSGNLSRLDVPLSSAKSSDVICYFVSINEVGSTQQMDPVDFHFDSTSSGIWKNGQQFRQIKSDLDLKRMFRLAFGRLFDSDIPTLFTSGEKVILTCPYSIFEIDNQIPDSYSRDDEVNLTLDNLTGMAVATDYVCSVHLIKRIGWGY